MGYASSPGHQFSSHTSTTRLPPIRILYIIFSRGFGLDIRLSPSSTHSIVIKATSSQWLNNRRFTKMHVTLMVLAITNFCPCPLNISLTVSNSLKAMADTPSLGSLNQMADSHSTLLVPYWSILLCLTAPSLIAWTQIPVELIATTQPQTPATLSQAPMMLNRTMAMTLIRKSTASLSNQSRLTTEAGPRVQATMTRSWRMVKMMMPQITSSITYPASLIAISTL